MRDSQTTKTYLPPHIEQLVLVGVGGTGGYLAQGVAKLVAGYDLDLDVSLIDPDIVEERNIYRQNFLACEVGHAKAEVLAARLNAQFGTAFASYVGKGEEYDRAHRDSGYRTLFVTCVDTLAARTPYAAKPLWLDCGNALAHGQVVFGTTARKSACKDAAKGWQNTPTVKALPNAALKLGLADLAEEPAAPSCAAQPFAEQGCFVNELAALSALTIVHQLLVAGTVTTPAIWFDLRRGRSNPARITKDYLLN